MPGACMACSLPKNFSDPCWQATELCQNQLVMQRLWNGMADDSHALHLLE